MSDELLEQVLRVHNPGPSRIIIAQLSNHAPVKIPMGEYHDFVDATDKDIASMEKWLGEDAVELLDLPSEEPEKEPPAEEPEKEPPAEVEKPRGPKTEQSRKEAKKSKQKDDFGVQTD